MPKRIKHYGEADPAVKKRLEAQPPVPGENRVEVVYMWSGGLLRRIRGRVIIDKPGNGGGGSATSGR